MFTELSLHSCLSCLPNYLTVPELEVLDGNWIRKADTYMLILVFFRGLESCKSKSHLNYGVIRLQNSRHSVMSLHSGWGAR